MTRFAVGLFFLLLFAGALPGGAQLTTAELVADLGPAPGFPLTNYLREPTRAGGEILFIASDEVASDQLWATDGTSAGTRRVRDLLPGLAESYTAGQAFGLVAAGDRAFFQTDDPLAGARLWVSDATRKGTVPIVSLGGFDDLEETGRPVALTAAIGRNLLFLRKGGHGRLEIWRTDGTPGDARLLRSVGTDPFGFPLSILAAAGRGFFFVGASNRVELWASDGTAPGTLRVAAFPLPSPESAIPPSPVAVGGRLFFVADDGFHGAELWSSDGTKAGTRQVRERGPGHRGANLGFLTAGQREAFFSVRVAASFQVWRSDGTEEGTVKLSSPGGLDVQAVAPLGSQLLLLRNGDLFAVRSGHRP